MTMSLLQQVCLEPGPDEQYYDAEDRLASNRMEQLALSRQQLHHVRTLVAMATQAAHDLADCAIISAADSGSPMKLLLDAWTQEGAWNVPLPTERKAIGLLSSKLRRNSGALTRRDAEKRLSGVFDELKQDRQVWFRDTLESAKRGTDKLQRRLDDSARSVSEGRELHHVRCTEIEGIVAHYHAGSERLCRLRDIEWNLLRERATTAADRCSADYSRWIWTVVTMQLLAAGVGVVWVLTNATSDDVGSGNSSTTESNTNDPDSDLHSAGILFSPFLSSMSWISDVARLWTLVNSFDRWVRVGIRTIGLVVVAAAVVALIAFDAVISAIILVYGVLVMFFGASLRLALMNCKGWLAALVVIVCVPLACLALVQGNVAAHRVELLRAAGVGRRGATSTMPKAEDCEAIHVSPWLKRTTRVVAVVVVVLSLGLGCAIGLALRGDSVLGS